MSEPDPEAAPPPGDGSAGGSGPPAALPETPPRAPGPARRARRFLIAFGVVVVLSLATAAVLLPVILSSDWFRATVEAKVSAASGRSVTLRKVAIGYSETSLEGLEIRAGPAATDPAMVRVESVRVPAGILMAVGSRYDAGTVEVRGLELRVDARDARTPPKDGEKGAAAADGRKKEKKDGAASIPVPPFAAKVRVTEGTILLVDLEGKERRVASFTAALAAASDAPATARLLLDLGTSGKLQVEIEAKPFAGGRTVPPDALEAGVKATAEALDLGALRETLVAATGLGLDALAGTVSARADARATGTGGTASGSVVFQGAGLVAAGPALGEGIRVDEPVLKFAAGFLRGSDGTAEVKDLALEMKGLHAKGNLSATKDGVLNGFLQANVSLEEMKARAERLGRKAPRVLQGDLAVEARATGDPEAQRFLGSLRAVDLHVGPAEGRLPVEEPTAVCDFDFVRIGEGFRIDAFSLKSGSALLDASGKGGEDGSLDVRATAKVQIARIQQVLAGFGLKVDGEFAGVADLEVRALRAATASGAADAPAESTATLKIRDLVVVPPGAGATTIREPLLEASLHAIPGKESVEVRALRWKGAGADLLVAGEAALDGKSGRLATVEASLDLAQAAALAGSLGKALPVRLSGTATWKGPVSWKDTFGVVAIEGGEAAVRGLEAVLPAADGAPERTLREESIRLTVEATATRAGAGREVSIARAVLAAAGLDATASGSVAADGTLALKAAGTLGLGDALRRAAALGLLAKDPATRGALDFDLTVRGKPAAAEVVLDRLEARDAEFLLKGGGRFAVGGAADADLEARGELGALADLAARAGLGTGVKGAAGKATVRLAAKAAGPDAPLVVSLDAGLEGLRWPDAEGGLPWTLRSLAATAKATVDRKAESAAAELAVKTDDGGATASGTFAWTAGKRAFDLKGGLDMDLGGLCRTRPDLLPLEGMSIGRVKGTLSAGGPLAEPFDLKRIAAEARLTLDSVKTQPLELREATADFFLQRGTVAARNLEAKVNGGVVKAVAAISLTGRGAKHHLEVKAEGVRIDPAMAFLLRRVVPIFAIGESGGVNGALRVDLRLDAEGADWNEAKPGLRGKGVLAVTDGMVAGNGIVGEVLELLGGGKGLGFDVVATEFEVREQRVWNDRLTVNGKEHALVIRGSTTFDGKLDYRVGAKALRISKKARERLQPAMDEEGNLPFQITGTLAKPKVRGPDLKKVLGGAADDLLDRLKGRLGDDDDEKDKDGKDKDGKKKR